ncbi:MAG: hypothetical protein Tsb002_20810 [Wenzhouxiangellaceae bacterium]
MLPGMASAQEVILGDGFERLNRTQDQLDAFYAPHGGRAAFPAHYIAAVETLLDAEDVLERGQFDSAANRVSAIFAEAPLSTDIWFEDALLHGLNVGVPIAYYGLRMIERIVQTGPVPTTDTLHMTAVVAPCANMRRPTLPDLVPEELQLAIAPEILADDARILHQSTALFRLWIKAITQGSEVELAVHELSSCTEVDFSVNGEVIVSYPDTVGMVEAVPLSIANQTDIWWVIAPSGVPGDGSGFEQFFITGGMGAAQTGAPLIISDDAWFTRKPVHLGSGPYSDVERRVYMPQWFQHEFMHHLFQRWPEFGLEVTSHQWFDRDTWPADFVGRFEPDYYSEAINKRLLDATPSLADGLNQPTFADFSTQPLALIAGQFERRPVQNDFHVVTVTVDSPDSATWSNQANVSWTLEIDDGVLRTSPSSPYGSLPVYAELNDSNQVTALYFQAERYQMVDVP